MKISKFLERGDVKVVIILAGLNKTWLAQMMVYFLELILVLLTAYHALYWNLPNFSFFITLFGY